MSAAVDRDAARARAIEDLAAQGIGLSDLRLFEPHDIERMRTVRARLNRDAAALKLLARDRRASVLNDLKGVLQDQPHNALALLNGLIPLHLDEGFGLHGDIIVDADHQGHEQSEQRVRARLTHEESLLQIVHQRFPVGFGGRVNGGDEA